MLTDSLLILGVLCLNLAAAEWLCRKTFFKHFGTALLVILVTAIVANLGVIPTAASDTPVYGWLLGPVVQLAVFWILLQVNLRELLKAGAPMISMFLIGSVGTFAGVMVGMMAVDGAAHFDGHHIGLVAMFTGTYTGGSINFNAMAATYKVSETGGLYAGAVVVDNIFTAVWMVMCIAIPRGVGYLRNRHLPLEAINEPAQVITGIEQDTESIHPLDMALLIALGAAAVGLSDWLSAMSVDWFATADEEKGMPIPSMLFLSIIALVLAQTPIATKLKGTRTLGWFAVYLFLAVIGALCDVEALRQLAVGMRLFVFVLILIIVHGIVCFGAGALFKVDRDIVAVASQANIGGGTSAFAIARSLGRGDLVLPAILVGSLGTALGNFLGWYAAILMERLTAGG